MLSLINKKKKADHWNALLNLAWIQVLIFLPEYKIQIPCKQASSFFIFNAVFSNLVSASISLNQLLQKLGRIW